MGSGPPGLTTPPPQGRFQILCPRHLCLVPKHSSPRKGAPTLIHHSVPSLSLQPWTTIRFVSLGISVLDVSQKWNHTACHLGVWLFSVSVMVFRLIRVVARNHNLPDALFTAE